MRISAGRLFVVAGMVSMGLVGLPRMAAAQYSPPSKPVVGEDYHIEFSYGWWNAEPSLIVNSSSIGIPGEDVDLVKDLGVEQRKLGKLDLVLRPAKKHKFRFERLPIKYEADAVVRRSFIFNGQRYNIGLPVQTTASFNTYRFGYEYDFLYLKRGFLGALFDLKYTDVNVELNSPIGAEFTSAIAPIPTIGVVGRAYAARNVAVGGEVSFFRVPDKLSERYDGGYTDYDFYATANFNAHTGAQVGYRSIDAFYTLDRDNGALKFKGLYFSAIVRY